MNGFVFTVGTNGHDGCVELVQISLVAFAYSDADAVAEVVDVGEGRADERVAFAGFGVQEAVRISAYLGTSDAANYLGCRFALGLLCFEYRSRCGFRAPSVF